MQLIANGLLILGFLVAMIGCGKAQGPAATSETTVAPPVEAPAPAQAPAQAPAPTSESVPSGFVTPKYSAALVFEGGKVDAKESGNARWAPLWRHYLCFKSDEAVQEGKVVLDLQALGTPLSLSEGVSTLDLSYRGHGSLYLSNRPSDNVGLGELTLRMKHLKAFAGTEVKQPGFFNLEMRESFLDSGLTEFYVGDQLTYLLRNVRVFRYVEAEDIREDLQACETVDRSSFTLTGEELAGNRR